MTENIPDAESEDYDLEIDQDIGNLDESWPPERTHTLPAWCLHPDDRRSGWTCKNLLDSRLAAVEITPEIEPQREGEDIADAILRIEPVLLALDRVWCALADTAGQDGLLACVAPPLDGGEDYKGAIVVRASTDNYAASTTTIRLRLGDMPIGTIRIRRDGRFRAEGMWRRFAGQWCGYAFQTERDKAKITTTLPDGIAPQEWIEAALKNVATYGVTYTMETEERYRRPKRTAGWTAMLLPLNSEIKQSVVANAIVAFRYAPEFDGVLRWNAFSSTVELAKRPPWLMNGEPFEPRAIQDTDFVRAQQWIQQYLVTMGKLAVTDAIMTVAKDDSYHPVNAYLDDLVWDGRSRIDSWLIDHLGAADTPLNRAFGAKSLIGAVARIRRPGCKLDTMLILEGPQNLGKSQALRVLGGEWFIDHLPDIGEKDCLIQLQNAWIVEQAELAGMRKADVDKLKSFMSTQVDVYRPPYGRVAAQHPRHSIIFGTLNPSGNGYLRDETGARRFWPVLCAVGWDAGRKVNLDKLREARDQLWAEALVRFERGEAWWLDDRQLERQAEAETDQRYDGDAWTDTVLSWIDGKPSVTTEEVLRNAIGMSPKDWTKAHQMRVGGILRKAGWTRKRDGDGARTVRYHNPNPPKAPNNVVQMHREGAAISAGRGPLADLIV